MSEEGGPILRRIPPKNPPKEKCEKRKPMCDRCSMCVVNMMEEMVAHEEGV